MIRLFQLISIVIITTNGFNYNENDSRNNLGTIYIKNVSPAKVFCRYRAIEFSLELENIIDIKQKLSTTTQLLHNICFESPYNKTCLLTMNEIKQLMISFDNQYLILESINIHSKYDYRKKREINEIIQKTITLSDYGYSDLKQNYDQLKGISKQVERYQNDSSTTVEQVNFNSLAYLTIQNIKRHLRTFNNVLEIIINQNPKLIAEIIPLSSLKTELITA